MKTGITLVTLIALFVIVRMLTLAQASLTISSINPNSMIVGQKTIVTINGSGFIEETAIQIVGLGTVTDTFISDNVLSIEVPASLNAGSYSIVALNPDGETAIFDNGLLVSVPTATPTATATATPTLQPLTIMSSEPQSIFNDKANTLSILGSGFTEGVVVRLTGYGLLETSYLHSGAIIATVPAGIPVNQYIIEVSNAFGQTALSPYKLKVNQAVSTPAPQPTQQTVSMAPALSINSFAANPATIKAGQSTLITFTVHNRGNQIARMIVASLGTGSQFVVSGGQASIAIPDLAPNTTYTASMTVTAQQSITAGANTIPVLLTYRNPPGETYTSDSELSVTISPDTNQSQILIDAYALEPTTPKPGDIVALRLTLMNSGNSPASQVAIRVSGSDSVLLPGNKGDTFVVGTLEPGTRIPLELSLIVNSAAEAGVQVQSLTIDYIQNGEAKQITTGITVNIARVDTPQPLILLSGYETGFEMLQPGTRFTLLVTLQNAGLADANAVTVTFGTVQSSDGGSDDPNNPDGESQTNTSLSTTFAPLGTAGLSFVGTIAANSSVDVSQEFIVAGDVATGIYSLPITVQYSDVDGKKAQSSLQLSLIVIAPPRLRINPQNPLPETVNASEPVPITLELANVGRKSIELTEASVSAVNGEVIEGALILLEKLAAEDDTSLTTVILPLEEGELELTISLAYLNELGQTDSIELVYSAQVMPAPEPIDEPFEPEPVIPEPEPQINWFGRIVMALVGLGS